MNWGYDLEIYADTGLKIPIRHSIQTHCHALITGSSGSGKSYALLYLLGQLLKFEPDTEIYFCDFKNSEDFAFLSGLPHFYSGNDCYRGIMEFYQSFTDARITGENRSRHVLICDEYPAFVNYLQMQDKANKTKYANDILGAVSEVLMLGRGIEYGIWIVTQRADSSLFSNGTRDNFMLIVALGRLSKEQKAMLFSGENIPDSIHKQGEGLLLADGSPLCSVKYPRIINTEDWKKHILSAIRRCGGA